MTDLEGKKKLARSRSWSAPQTEEKFVHFDLQEGNLAREAFNKKATKGPWMCGSLPAPRLESSPSYGKNRRKGLPTLGKGQPPRQTRLAIHREEKEAPSGRRRGLQTRGPNKG